MMEMASAANLATAGAEWTTEGTMAIPRSVIWVLGGLLALAALVVAVSAIGYQCHVRQQEELAARLRESKRAVFLEVARLRKQQSNTAADSDNPAARLAGAKGDDKLAAIRALAKPCSPAAACRIWYVVADGKPAVVAKILAETTPAVSKPLYAMPIEDYELHRRYYDEIYDPAYEGLEDDEMRKRIAKKWNLSVERLSDSTWHSVGLVIWQAVKAGRVMDLRTNK